MTHLEFEVYNNFGQLIAKGNSHQCAEALEITQHRFLQYANLPEEKLKKWRIKRTYEPEGTLPKTWDCQQMIKKWDDFVTPIRERFGVPVYCGDKEV